MVKIWPKSQSEQIYVFPMLKISEWEKRKSADLTEALKKELTSGK